MESMGDTEQNHEVGTQSQKQNQDNPRKLGFWGLLWRPIQWFKMLSEELHWSLVLGVVIVYGVSQGLGVGLSRVSTLYYMKDEQRMQPSETQVYFGMIHIPWVLKPLWGLLTDTVPILGYRRRPYFISAGFLGVLSMLVLSLHKKLPLALALLYLISGSAGVAIADVTIDACVTQNSKIHPSLASDMQSLCGLSSSVGALIGYSLSGFFVHLVGPKGVFGLLSIPPGLVVLVGFVLRESRVHNFTSRSVREKLVDATKTMWTTLKCQDVWRPCLYMYLSLALSMNINEGMFYWYTDAKGGPSFSQELIGSTFAVGAVGSLLGVLIYQNLLKRHPLRDLLFWTQLLYGASGLLDLVLVLRINLKIHVPDYFFAVMDSAVTHMIGRLKWMPLLVFSSKICPTGIEGTFFALLMSIDQCGLLSSAWAGGLLLHILKVTRTRFDNLWVAILIRTLARLVPLGFLYLIPRNDPSSSILPTEMSSTKKDGSILESDTVEMTSLLNST